MEVGCSYVGQFMKSVLNTYPFNYSLNVNAQLSNVNAGLILGLNLQFTHFHTLYMHPGKSLVTLHFCAG